MISIAHNSAQVCDFDLAVRLNQRLSRILIRTSVRF
jgi:hypothetical protein